MSIGIDVGVSASVSGAANMAVGVGMGIAAVAGARIPATLRCFDPIEAIGLVPFDFNPEKIAIKRSATYTAKPSMQSLASPNGASGTITKTVQAPTITLDKVIFEGLTTKWRCDQLLRWMSPFSGLPGLGGMGGANIATTLPVLTFQWGPPMVAFMYDVRLINVGINYTRFDSTGIPLRAEIALTMKEQPSLLASLPTNPTSGGLPGRRTHTVTPGDTLQTIAMTHYNRPGLWRRIAEVNKIDNPSRLRPGQTIYLPNHDELVSR